MPDLSYRVHTFGCKVNTYDTSLLQKRLTHENLRYQENNPRIHVLNTCAVTAEATREAVKTIRRLKAKDPFCTVVVTGCAAQVDTDQFAELKGADLVVANSHKGQMADILHQYFNGQLKERVFKSNIFKKLDLEEGAGVAFSRTRTFLKIQDGCNSFCTFCVIPFARGKSRSLTIDHLVARINELASQGVQEVVLTGVHIGDYQDETRGERGRLEDLIEQILHKTTILRVRLTSLEPIELSPRLLDFFSDERMCRHFHMSIQSANTKVLRDMKRQYDHVAVERSLRTILAQVPGAFVGMDVIVGFPGETDNEYRETRERLQNLPWTRLHVFPYSQRPGTYATRMTEQVSALEIAKRAQDLRELSSVRYQMQALAQIGSLKRVLRLKDNKAGAHGLSRDYWQVALPAAPFATEGLVRIVGFDHSEKSRLDGCLVGEVI